MYVISRERPRWPDTPNIIIAQYLDDNNKWCSATSSPRQFADKEKAQLLVNALNMGTSAYKHFVEHMRQA